MRWTCTLIALLACVGDRAAAAESTSTPTPISFRNDVLPVLSKVGCNAGACHGGANGKGGFKLSLRGYAPELDYATINAEMWSRRVDLVEPERSLILLKPSGGVPHQGGLLLEPDSSGYEILLAWLRRRVPPPREDDPRVTSLSLEPSVAVMEVGATVSLRVSARFSDDRRRDVTAWARFDTNDTSVAVVDDAGVISVAAPGKASIGVAYQDQVAAVELTVPFPAPDSPRDYAALPRNNFIDEPVIAQWEALRLWPSDGIDDAGFLRRAYLDCTGTLPEPDAVRAFLADTDVHKRDALVDRLLESPAFVDMWSQKWGDIFRASREWIGVKAVWNFHRYLRDRISRNVGWDEVVRELVAGSGDSFAQGPVNFYRLQKVFNELHLWPLTASETVAQTFLGIRMQCARCHDHPNDHWTQADYYGMAAFFAQVGSKTIADGHIVIHDRGTGEINHPRLGRPLPPQPPGGPVLEDDDRTTRRQRLARWITAPENPYFARATANRVWRHFMGRGLVEPVDDLRTSNLPTNDPLLDALARELVEHEFDIRHLMRTILTSRTYQLASTPTPENQADTRFASHYTPRRMTAEQILDAFGQVTGRREQLTGLPAAFRAQQLPDTKVASSFLDQFGRPLRRTASCECERVQGPNLSQALELMNSQVLVDRVAGDDALIQRMLDAGAGDAEIVESVYLRCVGRRPTVDESAAVTKAWIDAATETPVEEHLTLRRAFFEDLLWALMNTKEFLFNH
jgi:hypothetical protein